MQVFRAGLGSLDAILELGERFLAETAIHKEMGWNSEKVEQWVTDIIIGEKSEFWVAVEPDGEIIGFMSGRISESAFSDATMADPDVFYVLPEYRGSSAAARLATTYLAWAEPRADFVFFGSSTGINPETVKAFGEKLGFEPFGFSMVKRGRLNS